MSTEVRSRGTIRRIPFLYGLAWALFYAVLGILLVFFFANYGDVTTQTMVVLAYTVHCIATLFGAIAAGRNVRERGWYVGSLTGLSYALLMTIISMFSFNTFSFDASGLFRFLLITLIGAFGGMIGLGLRRDDD